MFVLNLISKMNEGVGVQLKSRDLVKQLFDIEEECLDILRRKPKVSKNVFQAYNKDIMEIAKGYKNVFLSLVEKKQKSGLNCYYKFLDLYPLFINWRMNFKVKK